MIRSYTLFPLCLLWLLSCTREEAPGPHPKELHQESVITRLQNEPATVFDVGMTRLQTSFFLGQEYDEEWFRRNHPGIEFTLDMVMFWPSEQNIMIHRDIKTEATLANCTLAIETLRKDLLLTGGAHTFVQNYFWHYRQDPPGWLESLPDSIFLVGDVYDPKAKDTGKNSSIQCESGLTQQNVRVITERRIYQ
jgi:hypothetical protein